MSLSLQQLTGHVRHTLRKASDFPDEQLVNEAGEWLLSCHPWKFLERPPRRLNIRGTVTITAATWTEATLTLLVTSPATAFADYDFLEGDQLEVTDGTGATVGFYRIASNPTTSSLVLESSIGSAANAQTDIAGEVAADSVRLPSDFQELISAQTEASTPRALQMISLQSMLNMRGMNSLGDVGCVYGAIAYGDDVAGNGDAPVPRLEIYPKPSANSASALLISYRAGWRRMGTTDDLNESNTPNWFDPLLIQAVRAYARGIQEEDQASMMARLQEVKLSVFFMDIARRDGAVQRDYGMLRGSGVRRSQWPPDYHTTTLQVSGP